MVYDIKYSDFIANESETSILLNVNDNKLFTSSTDIHVDLSIFNGSNAIQIYITLKNNIRDAKRIYFTGKSDKQILINLHENIFGFIEDMTNVTITHFSRAVLYKSYCGMYIPINKSVNSLILGNYIILDDDCFFIDRKNKLIESININECPHIHLLNQLVGYMV